MVNKQGEKMNELEINGKTYVLKGTPDKADSLNGLEYKIVRTYSAGVFAGYLESRVGQEVVLRHARRLWAWFGAASLSQLAVDGTSLPGECKFPCEVSRVELLQVIEILDVTKKAQESIAMVKIWKA